MAQSLHQSEGMILISLRMGRLMKTNLAKSSLFWTTAKYKYMFLQPATTACSSVITQTSRLFFAQGITVQAVINNVTKTFTLNNLSSVSKSSSDNDYQLMVVSFPQLEELISPHMCRSKPRINEEKQIGEVFYISGRFCPYDLHSRYKNT